MKKAKKIFRDFFSHFVGIRRTHNEKMQNSDPEIKEYVRDKRKPNRIPDGYTDTKWLKKLNDKSWKTRCKKEKQYIKHEKTLKEEERLGIYTKMLQRLKYKYRDRKWHNIPIDSFGFIVIPEMREEIKWIEKFINIGIFEAKYKVIKWQFDDFGTIKEKSRKVIEKVRLK